MDLRTYLFLNKTSNKEFGEKCEMHANQLGAIKNGNIKCSLRMAAVIESKTNGQVCMEELPLSDDNLNIILLIKENVRTRYLPKKVSTDKDISKNNKTSSKENEENKTKEDEHNSFFPVNHFHTRSI